MRRMTRANKKFYAQYNSQVLERSLIRMHGVFNANE